MNSPLKRDSAPRLQSQQSSPQEFRFNFVHSGLVPQAMAGSTILHGHDRLDLNIFASGFAFADQIGSHILGSAEYLRELDIDGLAIPEHISYFVDSGGFQAWTDGRVIDVRQLGEKYRAIARQSHGRISLMSLDIVPGPLDIFDADDMLLLATAQTRNTEQLLEALAEMDGKYRLFNPLHGLSWQAQSAWLEAVRHPDLSSYAIGNKGAIITNLPLLAQLIYCEEAEAIHFFGQYKPEVLPLLAVVGLFIQTTTDSSHYWANAQKFNRFYEFTHQGSLVEHSVGGNRNVWQSNGEKVRFKKRGGGGLSNCPCPVCQRFPDLSIYANAGRAEHHLLGYHNMWATNRMIEHWKIKLATQPIEEVAEDYGTTFGRGWESQVHLKENMLLTWGYLQTAKRQGPDNALRQFGRDIEELAKVEIPKVYVFLPGEESPAWSSSVELAKNYL